MAFGPPPGPFGPGGSGFPPPAGFPAGGAAPFGGVVVHRARLLPRLLLVTAIMGISFLVTGLVVWFAVVGTADDVRDATGGVTAPATQPVSVPQGWPAPLAPPEGATVVSAVTSSGGTPEEQLIMVYEVDQAPPAVAGVLRTQLAAAGLTITTDAIGAEGTGSLAATGGGREATVAVGPTAAEPGVTTVSWVLRVGLR